MIRVLVVDDSSVLRRVIGDALAAAPGIEVVGTAINGRFGVAKARSLKPDVITMDVEMPQMDGIAALEEIMRDVPTAVVMVSSLTTRGAAKTLEALEKGAVDYVAKPPADPAGIEAIREELIAKVRAAASARVPGRARAAEAASAAAAAKSAAAAPEAVRPQTASREVEPSGRVDLIVIGSSTGGVTALHEIFKDLPNTLPPIAITQHMPAAFTKSFAQRLSDLSAVKADEAADLQALEPGRAYIAPGDRHLTIGEDPLGIRARLSDAEKVSGHRPSVDVLFSSIPKALAPRTLAVILTGMGGDGAQGMLRLHAAGAWTAAQDRESCVVFGMPKEAIRLGAADVVLPLGKIAEFIAGKSAGRAMRRAS